MPLASPSRHVNRNHRQRCRLRNAPGRAAVAARPLPRSRTVHMTRSLRHADRKPSDAIIVLPMCFSCKARACVTYGLETSVLLGDVAVVVLHGRLCCFRCVTTVALGPCAVVSSVQKHAHLCCRVSVHEVSGGPGGRPRSSSRTIHQHGQHVGRGAAAAAVPTRLRTVDSYSHRQVDVAYWHQPAHQLICRRCECCCCCYQHRQRQ